MYVYIYASSNVYVCVDDYLYGLHMCTPICMCMFVAMHMYMQAM